MGGPHFTKKANRLGRDDARKNLMSTARLRECRLLDERLAENATDLTT